MRQVIFLHANSMFDSYAIAYWITVLEIDGFVAGLAYVANAFLVSLAFGVCTGTIGFFAAYTFVRRLYSALKVRHTRYSDALKFDANHCTLG